jgi:glycosyltransferase involved in cell wall biosynthesis
MGLPMVMVGTDALTFGVPRALAEVGPDLVHIHAPLTLISTQTSAVVGKVPLMVTYHGDYHKSSLPGNLLKSLRNRFQLPYVLRNARTVIALSRSDRRLLCGYGIDPERIEIVNPGLDIDKFECELPPDGSEGRRILYVGRIVYEKGIKELITSFGAVCGQEEGVELQVAGDGDALDDMKALAIGLGIEHRVSFLGWVDHDEMVEHYKRAMMVVLPSFSEGMPYALLEGMAAGKPVIASDVSGMNELVDHGTNGLLYDINDGDALADAMLRLSRDPAECERMGGNGRELICSSFSRERWLEDTVRVYEKAL